MSATTNENTVDITTDDGKTFEIYTKITTSGVTPPTPTPSPTPSPTPEPPTPTGDLGPDGVKKIFHDKQGGTQLYFGDNPDKNKFNISYGTGSHIPYTKKTENGLTFFNTVGSPITYHSGAPPGRSVRIDMYPDGGIWSNNTKYDWQNNPGYLYTDKGIDNGEYTIYLRPEKALGTHQSCAWKLGGRDQDNMRSLFEICAADAAHKSPYAHWDYLHFPYVSCPVKVAANHGKMEDGKWYGIKAVRIVDPSKKFADFFLYEDTDPFDGNGKPKNGWKLIAHAHDAGTSGYKNIPCTWKSHKDLMRVDGFQSVSFALPSIREIDTVGKPIPQLSEVQGEITLSEEEAPNLQEKYDEQTGEVIITEGAQ